MIRRKLRRCFLFFGEYVIRKFPEIPTLARLSLSHSSVARQVRTGEAVYLRSVTGGTQNLSFNLFFLLRFHRVVVTSFFLIL